MADLNTEPLEHQDFLEDLRFSGNEYFDKFLKDIGSSLKYRKITDDQWTRLGPTALNSLETQFNEQEVEAGVKFFGKDLDTYFYFVGVRRELEEEVARKHIPQDLATSFEKKFFNRFSKVKEPELVAA